MKTPIWSSVVVLAGGGRYEREVFLAHDGGLNLRAWTIGKRGAMRQSFFTATGEEMSAIIAEAQSCLVCVSCEDGCDRSAKVRIAIPESPVLCDECYQTPHRGRPWHRPAPSG